MHFGRVIEGSLSQLAEIEAAADEAHPAQFCCGTRAQLVGLVTREDELGTARSVLFEMPTIILAPAEVGESSRESAVGGDSLVSELMLSGELLSLTSGVLLEDESECRSGQCREYHDETRKNITHELSESWLEDQIIGYGQAHLTPAVA